MSRRFRWLVLLGSATLGLIVLVAAGLQLASPVLRHDEIRGGASPTAPAAGLSPVAATANAAVTATPAADIYAPLRQRVLDFPVLHAGEACPTSKRLLGKVVTMSV